MVEVLQHLDGRTHPAVFRSDQATSDTFLSTAQHLLSEFYLISGALAEPPWHELNNVYALRAVVTRITKSEVQTVLSLSFGREDHVLTMAKRVPVAYGYELKFAQFPFPASVQITDDEIIARIAGSFAYRANDRLASFSENNPLHMMHARVFKPSAKLTPVT